MIARNGYALMISCETTANQPRFLYTDTSGVDIQVVDRKFENRLHNYFLLFNSDLYAILKHFFWEKWNLAFNTGGVPENEL